MPVRPARPADRSQVLAMMARLWPEGDDFLFVPDELFVWERQDGRLGGFAGFSVRPYVDGCESSPCPHVEGWWVDPDLRRQGIGRALIAAIEGWARSRGFSELGSDTNSWNQLSLEVHPRLGFEATEQVQYFRKRLAHPGESNGAGG